MIESAALERHDPITISNDAELVPPDRISGNGVRGGTGTPEDPFVIANWTISSEQETAIHIENVRLWVEIRNVTVVQDELRNDSLGIFVHQVDHLVIENVNLTGLQSTGIHVQQSNVTIRDSRIAVHSTPSPDAEYPAGPLQNSPAIWDGRGIGLRYDRDVSLRVVGNLFARTPVFVKPECVCGDTNLTFVDNTIHPYSSRLDRGYLRGTLIRIAGNIGHVHYSLGLPSSVQKTSFISNEAEALLLRGLGDDDDDGLTPEVTAHVRNNTYLGAQDCSDQVLYGGAIRDDGCSPAIGMYVLPSRVPLRATLVGNRFERIHETAVDVNLAGVSLRNNAFLNSGRTDNPRVWIRADYDSYREAEQNDVVYQEVVGNDFVRDPEDRRGLAIRYTMSNSEAEGWDGTEAPPSLPATDNYWGPAPPPDVRPWPEEGLDEMPTPDHPEWVVVGNVTVEPYATEPNVLSPSDVQRHLEEGAAGPLLGPSTTAVLVAGLLVGIASSALYARRRNR